MFLVNIVYDENEDRSVYLYKLRTNYLLYMIITEEWTADIVEIIGSWEDGEANWCLKDIKVLTEHVAWNIKEFNFRDFNVDDWPHGVGLPNVWKKLPPNMDPVELRNAIHVTTDIGERTWSNTAVGRELPRSVVYRIGGFLTGLEGLHQIDAGWFEEPRPY